MDTLGLILLAAGACMLVSIIGIKRELLLGYLVGTILLLIIIYFGEKGDPWTQLYKIAAGIGGIVLILGGGLLHSLFIYDTDEGKTTKDLIVQGFVFCIGFFICAGRFYKDFLSALYYILLVLIVLGALLGVFILYKNKGNQKMLVEPVSQKSKDTLINNIIATMEVSPETEVWFAPRGGGKFVARTQNIKRLGLLLVRGKGKNIFEPRELHEAYNYVLEHFGSHLENKQFELLKKELQSFVEAGGEIIIK